MTLACLLLIAAPAGAPLPALFQEVWAFRLREDPLFATGAGEHAYDDRLPSMTPADLERRARYARGALARLRAVPRSTLRRTDRISRDMLERDLVDDLADFEFAGYRIPLTADSGFHTEFAQLPSRVPLGSVKGYLNYVARLRAFPAYVDQQVALMRQGLAAGFTLPRVVLEGYELTIASHVVEDPEKSVFYQPFASFPVGVPEAERDRLREQGRAAVGEAIRGYRVFLEFMTREYVPGARATLGASELPRGREYYAHLVKSYTTLDLTPEEVHRIGREEVARIRGEMEEAIRKTGFSGDFAAFLAFLRTDPRFYPRTAEDLLKEATYIAKRMDGKLPSLFGRLPRLPYGVEPVPPDLAPKYTAGRYNPAPLGSPRAGYYWVNTYDLPSRTLYTLEALTLHEAVPGHHLQIALARELEGLPAFRRFAGVTAFTEGWGLYAERLGLEAGFYQDPYRDFGRLTYEMWRACRLVVDTGIHALGWSRAEAMDYLATNTALSLHEVRTEIDRYISWPGQALAYKIGEQKIRELRRQAEKALGPHFDLRAFHDAVLANGAVPLGVLEDEVLAWVAAERRRAPSEVLPKP